MNRVVCLTPVMTKIISCCISSNFLEQEGHLEGHEGHNME